MASISEPFIRRPVGTTLLAIGLFLVGVVAYIFLPVSAVPNIDFPSIRVSASRPGADPSVMAATVAAFMPPADYSANCKWLTESEVDVYATEFARTGFTGALQGAVPSPAHGSEN